MFRALEDKSDKDELQSSFTAVLTFTQKIVNAAKVLWWWFSGVLDFGFDF